VKPGDLAYIDTHGGKTGGDAWLCSDEKMRSPPVAFLPYGTVCLVIAVVLESMGAYQDEALVLCEDGFGWVTMAKLSVYAALPPC
jgi:hypothetical protein